MIASAAAVLLVAVALPATAATMTVEGGALSITAPSSSGNLGTRTNTWCSQEYCDYDLADELGAALELEVPGWGRWQALGAPEPSTADPLPMPDR